MQFDFFSLHQEAFGLDLSDLSLKIAKLKKTSRGARLSSFGEFPIPQGVLEQGEIKKEADLAALLRSAVQQVQGEKIKTRNIVASLPEEKAFLEVIQLPKISQEDIAEAIVFEAENYIPYPLETVYLDSQAVHPLKNHLDHTDALLASLPKTVVDSYVSLFKKAGFTMAALEIESLAQARALIPNEVSLVPLLIVDLGATRTSFIVFAGTSLRFTASVPVSSTQLTGALAKNLNVDAVAAENLKRKHGLENEDSEARRVFEILSPLLSGLAGQMKKYIDYYGSHASHQHMTLDEKEIKKVILTGGGANLKGLRDFLSKELAIEVELGNPWANIVKAPFHNLPPIPFDQSLSYSTALGLALRGLII
ncbi:MAG: type IV pilus assembly protein PilM [Candidatus Wildermuthbacteria bacterium]|nr:type IV pilus assembly protein PilM [Candidatus Wildermuthbacteria bacterium]